MSPRLTASANCPHSDSVTVCVVVGRVVVVSTGAVVEGVVGAVVAAVEHPASRHTQRIQLLSTAAG